MSSPCLTNAEEAVWGIWNSPQTFLHRYCRRAQELVIKRFHIWIDSQCSDTVVLYLTRPSQLAELSRSEFDAELFAHSAYVKFFVTFATKVPYLTFCKKMRQFSHNLIPNCLLLHLEAGRNLETFIASTFGYKPSSSTDIGNE